MILKHASSQKIWITIFLFASSFSRGSKIENWYKPLHKNDETSSTSKFYFQFYFRSISFVKEKKKNFEQKKSTCLFDRYTLYNGMASCFGSNRAERG